MSDQQIFEGEGSVKSQSEMDQLQQFKRAGNKKKRTRLTATRKFQGWIIR